MPANYGFLLDLSNEGSAYCEVPVGTRSFRVNAAARPITAGKFDPFGYRRLCASGYVRCERQARPALGDDTDTDDVSGLSGSNCTDEAGSVNRCGTLMGGYVVSGNSITLTLPLDFILAEGADPEVRFTGTFTATKSLGSGTDGRLQRKRRRRRGRLCCVARQRRHDERAAER